VQGKPFSAFQQSNETNKAMYVAVGRSDSGVLITNHHRRCHQKLTVHHIIMVLQNPTVIYVTVGSSVGGILLIVVPIIITIVIKTKGENKCILKHF